MSMKKNVSVAIKGIIIIFVALICLGRMVTNGVDTYQDSREIEFYNFGFGEENVNVPLNNVLNQIIITQGNEIKEIAIYLTGVDVNSEEFVVARLIDGNGNIYSERAYSLKDCINDDWNVFPVNVSGLRNNAAYILQFSSQDENVQGLCKVGEYDAGYFGNMTDSGNSYNGALNCGIEYEYHYLTVGSIFQIIADYLIVVGLLLLFAYSVLHFEKLYDEYSSADSKKGLIISVCSALMLFFAINPISEKVTGLEEYSRNIGVGIMEMYDVTRVIRNFNLCFIVLFVSFAGFYLLFNSLEKNLADNKNEIYEFVSSLNVLFTVNLCLRGLLFYLNTDTKSFHYATYVFIMVYLCTYLYAKTSLGNKVSQELYAQYLISVAALGVSASACITGEWRDGRFMLGVQCILTVLVIAYVKYAKVVKDIRVFMVLASWMPLMLSVFSEVVFILNQRHIYVSNPKACYIVLTLIYIVTAVAVAYVLGRKAYVFKNYKDKSYTGLILGFTAMAVQPHISDYYAIDFIESSNASILISDFLNFGSIPIVEHYGGHMMSGVWEGIAYGLLTGDKLGAVFSPYLNYFTLIIAILIYWLLKNVVSEDVALLTVLLIPFYGMSEYYGLGLLIAIALVAYNKKQSLLNGFMIWLAFAWVTLYRLDMGFSYLYGIGLVLISGYVISREFKYLKNAVISLAITGVAALGAWVIICVAKGIEPVVRMKEFLLLSASNQTWAYGGMGDTGITAFPVMYLFLPILVVVVLTYILISKSFRSQTKGEIWLLLVFLGGAYFGNFSRTIVRHSVYEMKIHILTWSALLFVALFITAKLKDGKLLIPLFMAMFVLMMTFKSDGVYNEQPIANRAASNVTSLVDSWSVGRFNKNNPDSMTIWQQSAVNKTSIQRIINDEETSARVEEYRYLIDNLLQTNQSFIECMDRTFLYSILGRKNPLYVSQSPIQISGEFSQEQYIAEIEASKEYCPILLLPVNGDNYRASSYLEGTPHAYKYYKVFEYIYEHYSPVCAYSDIAVWSRNENLEETKQNASKLEGVVMIDWGYDGPVVDESGTTQYQNFLHNYELRGLANAWANLDVKNAVANEVIDEGVREGSIYHFDLKDENYKNPAYLGIKLQGTKDCSSVTVVMGDDSSGAFIEKCKYTLDISDDVNYYMIRISSDYYWHMGEIKAMYVVGNGKVYADSAKIIMGD